jgi:hypothetical protein
MLSLCNEGLWVPLVRVSYPGSNKPGEAHPITAYSATELLFARIPRGLVIEGNNFRRRRIPQNNPSLVLNRIRIGLQMLHPLLQPAVLHLQVSDLLLEHVVLNTLLLISSDPIRAKNRVVSKHQGDADSQDGRHTATRTRKERNKALLHGCCFIFSMNQIPAAEVLHRKHSW